MKTAALPSTETSVHLYHSIWRRLHIYNSDNLKSRSQLFVSRNGIETSADVLCECEALVHSVTLIWVPSFWAVRMSGD
jgi:hypothetical protein